MPRDASGNYSLPTGNPVISGTIIEADWANTTLPDIGNEITQSLSRSGEGGMLAPLKHTDGSSTLPSITFLNEISSGLSLAGTNDVRMSIGTVDRMRWTATAVQLWNGVGWDDILVSGSIGTDDVSNDSGVTGATASAALDNLAAAILGLSSDDLGNDSGVAGATITNALDTLSSSDGVANDSVVDGGSGSVTDALNQLNDDISMLDSNAVANNSAVAGASVTAALNTLNSAIGALGSDDIANDSGITGTTVSDALDNVTQEGSFTGSFTGFSGTPTCTFNYRLTGGVVTLSMEGDPVGTSNATTMTVTGLPVAIRPTTETVEVPCLVYDGAGGSDDYASAMVRITTGGTMVFSKAIIDGSSNIKFSQNGFPSTGTKGLSEDDTNRWSITYPLN